MPTTKKRLRYLLSALLAAVIFGFSFMFSRLAMDAASPIVLLAFRFVTAFVSMSMVIGANALVGKLRGKPLFSFSLRGKNILPLLALGIVQPVLYFFFENYSILYTSSAVTGTIIAVIPVACILVDVLILRQKVRRRQVICALLCVGGVALIYAGGETVISWLGMVFLLLTLITDVAYYTLSHKVGKRFNAFEVTYVMFIVGMVVFVPAALIEGAGHMAQTFLPAIQSGGFWIAVVYLGTLSSVAAFSLLNFANAHLSVSETSIFSNVTTAVSVLAGVLLLKEPFGIFQFIGVAVILVCVYTASVTPKEKTK
ncbi:MAG: DMT family transporter [Oscillospiraceae bacterium]|nr:DMT family transporter [Oscillospiraceae bacterium]